jgi:hypothetical protein
MVAHPDCDGENDGGCHCPHGRVFVNTLALTSTGVGDWMRHCCTKCADLTLFVKNFETVVKNKQTNKPTP